MGAGRTKCEALKANVPASWVAAGLVLKSLHSCHRIDRTRLIGERAY